jgi:hypothetical protein
MHVPGVKSTGEQWMCSCYSCIEHTYGDITALWHNESASQIRGPCSLFNVGPVDKESGRVPRQADLGDGVAV